MKLLSYSKDDVFKGTHRLGILHNQHKEDGTTIQWLEGSDSELGVPIFPIDSLFNGEPRSYLDFPNHLID